MKVETYAQDSDMNRAFYEFSVIHYKAVYGSHPYISMMDVKDEMFKCISLQRRVRASSLSHMTNLRKAAKDVYFSVLG